VKKNTFTTWIIIGAVVATISLFSPKSSDPAPTDSTSVSASDSATPDASLVPSEEPSQVELAYWPDGLDVEDVTYSDASGRDCTFDLCIFVKVTALRTCSGVTLDGETYDATDEPVDDFSEDLGSMKKGASRIFELGTDTIDDTEEYVDLYDATCWK
jgi:hypothetical protein